MDELIPYMEYEWLSIEDGVVTIGLSEDAAEDLAENIKLNLPAQDDMVNSGKICGDIETDSGSLNIYSPIDGTVIEVNEAILENPNLIQEDPIDEGWLIKVEADNVEKLDKIAASGGELGEDDEDEYSDDDNNEEEE